MTYGWKSMSLCVGADLCAGPGLMVFLPWSQMPRNRRRTASRYRPGIAAVVSVILVVAAVWYFLSAKPKPAPEPLAPTARQSHARASRKPSCERPRAYVAIIIDDLGGDLRTLRPVLGLDYPVSVAVLPGLPNSAEAARQAEDAGRDVLVHIPMQPHGDCMKGLGPGALMAGMGAGAIRDVVRSDLSDVPGAKGVNNHMGSLLTEDKAAMSALMDELARRGLFFVDSMTSSGSVALESAKKNGVPAARRNVFLDDADDLHEIEAQFDRMAALALRDGSAIAIGHPRPATIAVLKKRLPGLRSKGVELVGISELVE